MIQSQQNRFGVWLAAATAVVFLMSGPVSAALAQSSPKLATRGTGVGTYAFSSFLNYAPYTSSFQVSQGPLYVMGSLAASEVTYETLADGTKTAHIVKDTYLNGMLAYPVRLTLDIKLVNVVYKLGTVKWVVTNRPGAADRTWMTSTAITGSLLGYLAGNFPVVLDPGT
jgi:hypothetical protein